MKTLDIGASALSGLRPAARSAPISSRGLGRSRSTPPRAPRGYGW